MSVARRPFAVFVAIAAVVVVVVVVVVTMNWRRGGGAVDDRSAAGPLVVDDALAEVAFADVDAFVALARRAAQTGLVAEQAGALSVRALDDAGVGAPLVVAVRRSTNDVFVSARVANAAKLNAALAVAVPQAGFRLDRRLGSVDAVVDEQGLTRALLRVDDVDVVVAVSPTDELATAALLESMASGVGGRRRTLPASTELTLGTVGALRAAKGTIAVDGDDVVVDGVVVLDHSLDELVGGLRAATPSVACAVEDGAVIAARLPPLAGRVAGAADVDALGLDAGDAFDGRVVVALHAPPAGTPVDLEDRATLASLVVAGRPRAGARAGLVSSLGVDAPTAKRVVAGRTVYDIVATGRPWRSLSAVVDDDVFALGVGATAPVDRVAAGGTCPPSPARLLVVDGRALRALVGRASPRLALLAAALGQADGTTLSWPWGAFLSVDRVEVDASPAAPERAGRGDLVTDVKIRVRIPSVR